MAAPAKFLFDTDFSAPERQRERPATTAEIAQKVAVQLTAHVYQERPFDPRSLVPSVLGAIVALLVILRGLVAVSRLRRRYRIVRAEP